MPPRKLSRRAGLQAWVTGPAGFVADLVTAFGGIDGVLLLVALGAVLLILVLVYRSPFLPFVVIFTAGLFALCLAGLVIYNLAANGTWSSTASRRGSCPSSWSALRWTMRCCSSRGTARPRPRRRPADAMKRACARASGPIAASAGTVIAGVLCLGLSDLGSNRSLGPVAAIGIASASSVR